MKKLLFLSLSSFIFLASCNSNPIVSKKYTINFINDDGELLQSSEVEEGAIPKYDGGTPFKQAPSEHEYVYIGWDKPIKRATEDTTYKATYDYVFLFGTYPQTLVSDNDLINALSKESPIGEYDYISYEGKNYFKQDSEQDYKSDDGTRVKENDEKYIYYEVKPIQWKILGDESDKFYTTYKLLDTCNFNKEYEPEVNAIIFPNNYCESEMRKYLNSTGDFANDGFKWRAFRGDTSRIDKPKIINDANSTKDVPNLYACEDIPENNDQIFALSRAELRDKKYGFNEEDNIDSKRTAKSTDYARARNATLFNDNTSTYWTRSPSASELGVYKYNAYNVTCDGSIQFNSTDIPGRCIRPAIKLSTSHCD
ncbi:MAG: DUF6273 domain-containing protein [Bacilli bacterium]|nr:DUF6273 domain-containing protein [Bacilli bacterium]